MGLIRSVWRYRVWWLTPIVLVVVAIVGLLLLGGDSSGTRVYPRF